MRYAANAVGLGLIQRIRQTREPFRLERKLLVLSALPVTLILSPNPLLSAVGSFSVLQNCRNPENYFVELATSLPAV